MGLPQLLQCVYIHANKDCITSRTRTDFIITGSSDGVLMFWKKKNEGGIEFVKTFRSHLGPITGMAASVDGLFLCTASADKSLKIYDILNFGMCAIACCKCFKFSSELSSFQWI